MRKLLILATVYALSFSVPSVSAQRANNPTRPIQTFRSREIAQIVREIDERRIEMSIRKLVSFGSRNTLGNRTIQIVESARRAIGCSPSSQKRRNNPAGA